MNRNNDKRAHIVSVSIVDITQAQVRNFPAITSIQVSAPWTKIPMTDIQFEETDIQHGSLCEQKFSGKVTSLSETMEKELKNYCSKYLLFKLEYSNGDIKIVGTDEYPVSASLDAGGEYHLYKLAFKRNSPEASKFLI